MPSMQDITQKLSERQTPKVSKLRIVVEADTDPDLSHLEQDYADVADEAERGKYVSEDLERRAAYDRDEWHMTGIYLVADVVVRGARQKVRTPGVWGVESDCGEAYVRETADQEYHELKDILGDMGIFEVPPLETAKIEER